jgi:hypothetical protein
MFRTVPHVEEHHKLKVFTNKVLRGVVGRKTKDEMDDPCDLRYSGGKTAGANGKT